MDLGGAITVDVVVGVFVFMIGSAVGSFMNVCVHRLPQQQSILYPPSQCPTCGQRIRWSDNIPVLSFFLLRGKCRACKATIRPRYVVLEVMMAVILTLIYLAYGASVKSVGYSVFVSALIAASAIDFELQVIPDQITVICGLFAVALSAVFPSFMGETVWWKGVLDSLMGVAVGAGSIALLGIFGKIVFKKEAMGEGDIFFLGMIGAFLGWQLTLVAFFLAPFFGAVAGIYMKIRYKAEYVPYGPYLSLGALGSLLVGPEIIKYLFAGFC